MSKSKAASTRTGKARSQQRVVSLRGWIVGWRRASMKYFLANPMPGNCRVAYANEREEKAMERLEREKQANDEMRDGERKTSVNTTTNL